MDAFSPDVTQSEETPVGVTFDFPSAPTSEGAAESTVEGVEEPTSDLSPENNATPKKSKGKTVARVFCIIGTVLGFLLSLVCFLLFALSLLFTLGGIFGGVIALMIPFLGLAVGYFPMLGSLISFITCPLSLLCGVGALVLCLVTIKGKNLRILRVAGLVFTIMSLILCSIYALLCVLAIIALIVILTLLIFGEYLMVV